MQQKKRALLEGLFNETPGDKVGTITATDLQYLFQPIDTIEAEKSN